jgi:glucose 1-dehydrogenase
MRAVTLEPRKAHTLALADVAEPPASDGPILVQSVALGVCGTDRELIEGHYGDAPPGRARLVIGHESLGRVIEAPENSGFRSGELVVGIVRHPDPVPCANCAVGEWDMCRNGRYTERGIKQADGFSAERWRSDPAFTVRVSSKLGLAAVLLEPASVLAKAWEHIDHIVRRSRAAPKRVLVTGAGPVGLMAALMGMQRALEVHVLDHNDSGPKPDLVRALGATYHTRFPGLHFDIVVECTGVPGVIVEAVDAGEPGSTVCLTGLGAGQGAQSFDVATLNQSMVLENRVVFGSVNANLRHYQAAAAALEGADRSWLERLLTRRVPLARWQEAYERQPGDVKTVLLLEG